jgi:hypothetical protein
MTISTLIETAFHAKGIKDRISNKYSKLKSTQNKPNKYEKTC